MLRSARISLRIGERLGLPDDDLAVLFDVAILTYVGCPIYGNEAAEALRRRHRVPLRGPTGRPGGLRRQPLHAQPSRAGSASPLHRARVAAGLMATGGRQVVEQMANHCSAAGEAG